MVYFPEKTSGFVFVPSLFKSKKGFVPIAAFGELNLRNVEYALQRPFKEAFCPCSNNCTSFHYLTLIFIT